MNRLALVVLLAIPLTCSANEYKFDFGTIEGGACSKTETASATTDSSGSTRDSSGSTGDSSSSTRDSSSSTRPVREQTYSRKLTRLIATVVAEPNSDEVAEVVNACGAKAGKELKKTRSPQNIGLFSDLFEEYMSNCASRTNSDIKIQYATVEYQEKCEK